MILHQLKNSRLKKHPNHFLLWRNRLHLALIPVMMTRRQENNKSQLLKSSILCLTTTMIINYRAINGIFLFLTNLLMNHKEEDVKEENCGDGIENYC
jgi:hypothetical protein